MLITAYNPNGQATCPNCGFVECMNTNGNLAFGRRYMDFYHEECKTEWRWYIDDGEKVILKSPTTEDGA